jgi:hypothetical protein
MKKNIWMIIALLFIGYSGGIVTGVVVDVDNVYHTTVKKIKQKKSDGTIVVDVDTTIEPGKTKKEIRKEEREQRRAIREAEKNLRKKTKKRNK